VAASRDLAHVLQQAGCQVVECAVVDDADKAVALGRKLAEKHVHALAGVAPCWFEDYLVVDLLEECPVPLLLWSLPGMETGALCGVQQLTFLLSRLGAPFRCVYGPMDRKDPRQQAERFLRAAALHYRLRRARVGMGGHRVGGMSDAAVNEIALKKALGPRVIPIDMPTLLERAGTFPAETAREHWQSLVARAGRSRAAEDDGLDAMQIVAAVEEEVKKSRLDALALGCYPRLMGRVCLAGSLLSDQGVPVGCEGDVNGAVGQLVLTLLTGQPTHNTDWLEPLEDGTVVFTHCGNSSFSLAENPRDIELAPVRLMHKGVCALFPSRPGPVTLLNLVPRGDGYQVALLEGEAISTEMVFPGNPLRVRFSEPTAKLISWIHEQGIGHHWMAGYGHVGEEIVQWAKMAGSGVRLIHQGF